MRQKIENTFFFIVFIIIIAYGIYMSRPTLNKVLVNQNTSHFASLPIPIEKDKVYKQLNFWPLIQDSWNMHYVTIKDRCVYVFDKLNVGVVEFDVPCQN